MLTRKIDHTVQSSLILIGLGLVLTALLTLEAGFLGGLLYLQLILGPYQVLSALLNLTAIRQQPKWFQRRLYKYLAMIVTYFLSAFILSYITFELPEWQLIIGTAIFFGVIPWTLALYYCCACRKRLNSSDSEKARMIPGGKAVFL